MDVFYGRVTRAIVMVPPQHGKSSLCSQYFPAWWLLRRPDDQIILASYGSDYADRWSRRARETLSEYGQVLMDVEVARDSSAVSHWQLAGHPRGGLVAAGVGAGITGYTGNLVIIDDPIKDAQEAQSEVIREAHKEWFSKVIETRMAADGAIVLVMTRWNTDDMVGWLLRTQPNRWTVIRLPAIAEEDESVRGFSRRSGEALCAALHPLAQLEPIRDADPHTWATLYQQRPYNVGGGFFTVARLRANIVRVVPQTTLRVRAWDLAATTKRTSKRTAGVRLSRDYGGRYYVEHVECGKWLPDERNARMLAIAKSEPRVKILFEHEGGSAGEDQALAITRLLAGHRVEGIRVTGDKAARADPVASQANGGNVAIVDDGLWDVEKFLSELESFPHGDYLDQVDALSLAFNWLSKRPNPRPVSTRPAIAPAADWRREFGTDGDWRANMMDGRLT